MPFVLAYSGGSAGDSSRFQIKVPAWLARLRLFDVLGVRLRRRTPRRLAFILALKTGLHPSSLSSPCGHHDPFVLLSDMAEYVVSSVCLFVLSGLYNPCYVYLKQIKSAI